ncbi:MAG: xanthine dehydrogenase family protein molybdopterin-binding subunit [Moritella sp.]|uniref:xanthine dehydrogenase family protein molybdopterin-binding subunit n=1 Tax=Moritella sp. TaxID=78556 RepID=UPI0021719C87|nr:molybdopterin cofactor-binding domain-containing protein [Moritella sp.]MBL1416665.1 xanthine dehydrogenase family protein molybdopterin-binding subunit [Moritella sp.]
MTKQIKHPTRRGFLGSAGALGFALLGSGSVSVFYGVANAQETSDGHVNAWVSISPDDQIIIYFGAAEMGQGVNTSLPMIVAEELDADWENVSVKQVDTDLEKVYGNARFGGNLFTAGSQSIEAYFKPLRLAGATARRILIQTTAEHWGVPANEVMTEPGVVLHPASGKKMSYGEVAALPSLVTSVPTVTEDDLKPRDKWRIIGTDIPRKDIPAKTQGEAIYSIDVVVPDMLYAAQLLAPVEGETPTITSDVAARAIAGVTDVIVLKYSVAVLATSFAVAMVGRDALEVDWSETSNFRSADSAKELEDLSSAVDDMTRNPAVWENRGDVDAALSNGGRVHTAHFTTEHVYHAQMEPLNAVASVDADGKGAEVWLGTQGQTISIMVAAGVLGTTPDRIRFHAMQMGGGFGRRTVFARELLRDALLLSKAVGRPVKLIWTREDDVKNGWLRPATAHRLEAVLDEDGGIAAMRHRVASPSVVAFAVPHLWDPESRRDSLVMEGTECNDYNIADLRSEQILTPRRSRLSAWRAIGWGPNLFARECFMDELAEISGSDPVAFRRNLLRNNKRGLDVLNAVIAMSKFGQTPEGRAHGLSFAGYKNTLAVGVAEVSKVGDGFRVHRFWAAVDPGIVVHPQGYKAQTEGGILFGLSSLMRERTTFSGGEIEQNNFYDYEPIRMNEIPEIEVHLVESGASPSGGGEIGVPMTGAAVANALRVLTGTAPRNIPFGDIAG